MKSKEQPIDEKPVNKEQPKDSKELIQIEEKYQKLCNLQYVKDNNARKELKQLIDDLEKINELVLVKISDHDLSIRFKGRQLAKVCPLKKSWSASLNGGKVQSYSKEDILSAIKEQMKSGTKEKSTPSKIQDDKAVIQDMENRISKLAKGSKGISIKGIKVTSEVKKWAKTQGYTLTGNSLLVN